MVLIHDSHPALTALMNQHAALRPPDRQSLLARWWHMLNQERVPCTAYTPCQRAQRILYRVACTAAVGVLIYVIASGGAWCFQALSGYNPIEKTGGWVAWWLYWLAAGTKVALTTLDLVYVVCSSALMTLSELFLQVWELREDLINRWRGNGKGPPAQGDGPAPGGN